MKKITLLVICFVSIKLQAQEIPNAGFENWEDRTYPNAQTSVEEPVGWITTNAATLFGFSPNAFKITESYSESFAIRLETTDLGGGIPFSSSATIAIVDNGNISEGFSFSKRPIALKAFYKYTKAGMDTAAIGVLLTKWNTNTNQSDTIGIGEGYISSSVDSYTEANVNIAYKLQENPDTAFIILTSSISDGYIGSTLFVDDLSFVYPGGGGPNAINNNTSESSVISVFPNPATNILHFTNIQESTNKLEIVDFTGRKINTLTSSNNNLSVDVSNYSSGIYTYYIYNGKNNKINRGKFSVKH